MNATALLPIEQLRADCPACGTPCKATGRRNRRSCFKCPACGLEWEELVPRRPKPGEAGGREP
jgi:hypothetical protein